jgi:glucose/arabinose dehydrogenase
MKKVLLSALLLCGSLTFAQNINLVQYATGFTSPTEMVHAGDSRLFVTQQNGLIRILKSDGTINANPFLNISNLTTTDSERGLLGLAFHPEYQDNGFFYINYTNLNGNTVIARYTRSATNPDLADANSAQILLTITQPFSNHNGGCLRFGPDGFLYIAMGDGGSGGDPNGNAQNINSLLGKILRIDVNNGSPYAIPASNPFADTDGADEIWATGLRNPWKMSFNSLNGDLWIADVGQENIEEINVATAGTAGLNYGWRCYEGNEPYNTSGCPTSGTFAYPVAQYDHSNNACSITGGFVYNGSLYPALTGKYIFGDFCSNRIGYTDVAGEITWTAPFTGNISTFGEDMNGELYAVGRSNGTVYRVTETTAGTVDFGTARVRLYPNPAKDMLNIDTQGAALPLETRIYDLTGKLITQKTITSALGNIALNGLSAGLYITEISNGSAVIRQKLIIE